MTSHPIDLRIPITIGVSGTRKIDEERRTELRSMIRDELETIQEACSNSELVMLNSIASEVELDCAQMAIDLGIKLVCPLPMTLNSFQWEYEGGKFDAFAEVLSLADESFVVKTYPRRWHEAPDIDDHYLCAEKYVRTNSYVMLQLEEGVSVDYRVHRIEGVDGEGLELLKKIDEINVQLADEEGVVQILNASDNSILVHSLLEKIEDTNLLRKAITGKYAYWMVKRIAELENKTEIDIAYENPKEIISAIQSQADVFSDKLLEELYERKYGKPFNWEAHKYKLDVEDQLRKHDLDEAFEGLQARDIEQFIIDLDNDTSLDEFEYIDARYENEYYENLLGEYHKWRRRKLCGADLI